MKKLSALMLVLFLCLGMNNISQAKEYELTTVRYSIPQELNGKEDAIDYLHHLAAFTDKYNKTMFGIVDEVKENTNQDGKRTTKRQKVGLMKVAKKLKKLGKEQDAMEATLPEVKSTLSESQQKAMDNVIDWLKVQEGESHLLSQEEISEQVIAYRAKWERIRKETEERLAAMSPEKRAEWESMDASPTTNNVKWWHLLFPIAVFGLFVYGITKRIKSFKNSFQDLGYAKGTVKEALDDIQNPDSKFLNGQTLSEAQKEDIEKAKKLLEQM